jgi:choline-sulfatase
LVLYVNYWDPHTPYRVPENFGNLFENDPIPEWLNEDILEQHKKLVGPHSVNEIDMYWSNPLPQYPRYPTVIKDVDDMKK